MQVTSSHVSIWCHLLASYDEYTALVKFGNVASFWCGDISRFALFIFPCLHFFIFQFFRMANELKKKNFYKKNQERKKKLSMFSRLIRCLVWSFTFFFQKKKKNLKQPKIYFFGLCVSRFLKVSVWHYFSSFSIFHSLKLCASAEIHVFGVDVIW